jgi:hypothetical protein
MLTVVKILVKLNLTGMIIPAIKQHWKRLVKKEAKSDR